MTAGLMRQVGVAFTLQGAHPAEQRLLDLAVLDRAPLMEPGVNDTQRVEFGDGTFGFHKSFTGLRDDIARSVGQETRQQPLHEVAAWRLASGLGGPWMELVPATVLRNVEGVLGSLSAERKGRPATGRWQFRDDQARAGGFFDALIGQQDRHTGNFLVDHSGRVSLIDHGFAFATSRDGCGNSVLLDRRHFMGEARLVEPERLALRGLLASPDTLGLQGLIEERRLEALKSRARTMLTTGELMPYGAY